MTCVCVQLPLAFRSLLVLLIDVTIAKWFDDYFSNDITTSVCFVVIIAIVTVWLRKRIIYDNYYLLGSFGEYTALSGLVCLWGYYRFVNPVWDFCRIFPSKNDYVAYYDIIIVVFVFIITHDIYRYFVNSKKRHEDSNLIPELNGHSIDLDSPIKSFSEDQFNRMPFVKNLIRELKRLDTKKSGGAIALIAPWGNGKTSFLNLLAEEIENDASFTLLHFSPWQLNPETSLTRQFFHQLIAEVGSVNAKMSNTIARYSKVLDGNGYGNFSLILQLQNLQTTDKVELNKILEIMFYIPIVFPEEFVPSPIIKGRLKELPESKEFLTKRIIDLANKNGASKYVSKAFSRTAYNYGMWEGYLSVQENLDILNNMLRFAISQKLEFRDIHFFYSHTKTYTTEIDSIKGGRVDKYIYDKTADELFRGYLVKNIDEIISTLVWRDHMRQMSNLSDIYYPSNDFMHLWETWNAFEEYFGQEYRRNAD